MFAMPELVWASMVSVFLLMGTVTGQRGRGKQGWPEGQGTGTGQ